LATIVYLDKEEYEKMAYLAPRGGVLTSITPYSNEEVGPDYESEGKVKVTIERIFE